MRGYNENKQRHYTSEATLVPLASLVTFVAAAFVIEVLATKGFIMAVSASATLAASERIPNLRIAPTD